MTLITTDKAKFALSVKYAIADLKQAIPQKASFEKEYSARRIKNYHKKGRGTFSITAVSNDKDHGSLIILVALATPDSQDANRMSDNDVTRLARKMCEQAGARFESDRLLLRENEHEPHIWRISASWGQLP